jgi:hypothetical protein
LIVLTGRPTLRHPEGEADLEPGDEKIGVWPGDRRDNVLVRRESGVDYWDRELS